MEFIRNVLILSLNTDWAFDLRESLVRVNKVRVDVAGIRSVATKYLSDKNYTAIIIEDSFGEKNINTLFRALLTSNIKKPEFIFLSLVEFDLVRKINIPDELKSEFLMYSHPMVIEDFSSIVKKKLVPMELDGNKRSFDREFVEILMKSCRKTFEKLDAFGVLRVQRPRLIKKDEDLEIAIRGKVIIKSEFFNGSLLLSFPEETYLKLYEKVAGTFYEKINSQNEDFAGEMANMVYGQAKKTLEQVGVHLDMAIPVTDKTVQLPSGHPIFVIPVETDLGSFYVKLALNYF